MLICVPAVSAAFAACTPSRATPWSISSATAPWSLMTKPLNCHCVRSRSFKSRPLAVAGMPLRLDRAVITAPALASMAALKGGR
ncbi:hypothetical protein EDP1_4024 [Pseudomonas putida S610]|nr:hypothetical protein EDP1_4024 [Pseudomonas putida S610]